jgi:hypothetical protein
VIRVPRDHKTFIVTAGVVLVVIVALLALALTEGHVW